MNHLSLRFFLFVFFLFSTACGSIETISLDDSEKQISAGTDLLFMFGTDYASSGQIYTADLEEPAALSNSGITGLGSSAVIRFFDGLLYILHDGYSIGSSDNVQILDPASDFSTVHQWSTGNGTNPHDLVVIGGNAYITLYNPENDPDNIDAEGNPGDLIVMNLDNGEINQRISFFDFLNDDGDRHAFADQMVFVDDLLYVALQDLESDYSHNTAGKIAVINTDTDEVENVLTLQGRNPVDLVASQDGLKLFAALQAPYDYTLGNFDTSTNYGGIEIVPLDDPENTILLSDDNLGGYVERLASGGNRIFAVVSQMDSATFEFSSEIVSMKEENEHMDGVEIFLKNSSDVREIFVDSLDRIWISRREISADDGSASDPQVDFSDLLTGEALGSSLVPEVSVTSIVEGNL